MTYNTLPEVRVEVITPTLAQDYLAHNAGNRRLRDSRVAHYARAMRRGEWQFNGDPIRFAADGRLLDGQHRLHAVVAADTEIETLVIRNLPEAAFTTMDQGLKRTASDFLSQRGLRYTTATAAAARLILAYDRREMGFKIPTVSATEVVGLLDAHPELITHMQRAIAWGLYRLMSQAQALFVIFVCYRRDHTKALEFFTALGDGANLDRESPMFKLRERLLNAQLSSARRLSALEVSALTFKAFRAFVEGTVLTRVVYRPRSNDAYPYLED